MFYILKAYIDQFFSVMKKESFVIPGPSIPQISWKWKEGAPALRDFFSWKEESHGEEEIEAANQEATSFGEAVSFPQSKWLSP